MIQLLLVIIYLAFISLGLPDSMLGAAWPSMYDGLGVPVSYVGAISMIIALGTILSSLGSDRLAHRLGTGKIVLISVATTAIALFGFSISNTFLELCLWALPYGLGAGSVDAALNNYVAINYKSRHMSWLHCMWGVGATVGPYIMGHYLIQGRSWSTGYQSIGVIQIALTAILLFSLPLWKKQKDKNEPAPQQDKKRLSLKEVVSIIGVKEVMLCFFLYCALEQTTGLWASSYLTMYKGIAPELAASYAGLFFIGITIGRAISGFMTFRLSDKKMIRLGSAIILLGIICMLLPLSQSISLVGLILIGLGCAPIYPCIIHSTPALFGESRSQAVIGVQMASAYIGTCLMPPLFGVLAKALRISLLPVYLLFCLLFMVFMYERLIMKMKKLSGGVGNGD